MKDNYGRDIYYLRLSVTERCNLRCLYCMPDDCTQKLESVMSADEIVEIARAASNCGISKVRITGGEPLLRRDILEICERIALLEDVTELCVTTNGILLTKFAEVLKSVGVNRLNISLDSLDTETYKKITRNGTLQGALDGLRKAIATGFDAIKINAVLLGGVNDSEVRELLELTRLYNINVRFIELMPIGQTADWAHFVEAQTVLDMVPELYDIGTDGVAKLYKLPGGQGTVGLISPISSHFCPTCNRIRISADGKLKPCLHSAEEIELRGLSGEDLENAIRDAILGKPQQHEIVHGEVSGSARDMNAIGG